MTPSVLRLLDIFDRLNDAEQQEAITELLRRMSTIDFAPLSNDELIFAADQVLMELDREEAMTSRTSDH